MMQLFSHTDWAVVLATLVGPVAAVAISIWLDRRARQRERRLSVINSLIQGATLSPLSWNQGMLQLPLEFGHHDGVMERWKDCNQAASEQRLTADLRSNLIKEALGVIGFPEGLAGESVRAMYRTKGVTDAEELQQNAFRSLPEIAAATGRSAKAAEAMLSIIQSGEGAPRI